MFISAARAINSKNRRVIIFDAWIDVINKYAIGERVDFVIMGGDFFHKRNVPPETMNDMLLRV